MTTYKEFLEIMKGRGYIHRNNDRTLIDQNNLMIQIFTVNKGKIGKILELTCPKDTILGLCGYEDEKIEKRYECSIKCFNEEGEEPFSKTHKGYILYKEKSTLKSDEGKEIAKGSVIDIMITKTVKDVNARKLSGADDCSNIVNPTMKLIGSKNPLEYPMIMGSYKVISEYITKKHFNIYEGEKMTFYVLDPDIDIIKVEFKMELDILEKPITEEYIGKIKQEIQEGQASPL